MRNHFLSGCAFIALTCLIAGSSSLAVTTKITRHSTIADFLKGQTENTVVGSLGTVSLGQASEILAGKFKEEVWSINSIIVSGPTVFIGTSPNGNIYKYSLGELTRIYPVKSSDAEKDDDLLKPPPAADGEEVKSKQYLSNEHVYAMAMDISGRLLAAVSGHKCRLIRFETGKTKDALEPTTVFEPNDARYIFAIALDQGGNIYLATGPEGKIYKLDSFAKSPKVIYTAREKNILSLVVKGGLLYAGSDGSGIIYKIDLRSETGTVLYDSGQEEITSLVFLPDSKDLYAAATSAEATSVQQQFAAQMLISGKPEVIQAERKPKEAKSDLRLVVPNTKKTEEARESLKESLAIKPAKIVKGSYIYRITPEGYVSEVFNETAVFFCLAQQNNKLLLGTGNNGQLFSIDPASEQEAAVYQDQQAPQITAVTVAGDDVYAGSANPAKLVKLTKKFSPQGMYSSELIDAGQPAKWGRLHIEADIPQDCKITVSSRSGNVSDINDPSYSKWTEPVRIKEPVQLTCPVGRFCQYKLALYSPDGSQTPVVRTVTVADTVPNLAPRVESVTVSRLEAPDKLGILKISYKARDENNDKLIYKIDFRQVGWINWIKIKDDVEAESFEWDGKTVEDGRYEIRVTASDERSNTPQTKLTGTRISEPVVVDNTPPQIASYAITKGPKSATLKMRVVDNLSIVSKVEYAVDSSSQWQGTLPDDSVYDELEEDFTILINDLTPGEHIISVRATDAVGNTSYKSFEVNI